jgi:hypothetical protein
MPESSDEAGALAWPMTSAVKAGWICFAIGLSISWFFPLGNAFFSLAIITAVVAMCTHQVTRGLALLLTSVAGIALSTLLFFTLVLGVVGTAAIAAVPAIKRADADLERLRKTQQESLNQLADANQRRLSAIPNAPPPPLARGALQQPSQDIVNSASAPQMEHEVAMTRAREAAERLVADETQRKQNIRRAERQRDVAKARERELEQLQKSIDYWDTQIQKIRAEGRDWRWASDQRDVVIRQKANLQSR